MRNTIEGFLKETEDLSDDTVLGASIGTDFYWKYGRATKCFWSWYFNDDCVVTMKHLRYLADLRLKELNGD